MNSNLRISSELPAAPVTPGTGGGKTEKVSPDHTRGGLKTYRRQCLEEIGGIMELDGWDGIDNIMAQMSGWETRPINRLEVHINEPPVLIPELFQVALSLDDSPIQWVTIPFS